MDIKKQIMLKDYNEAANKIDEIVEDLKKLKEDLTNNKDNVKKLYEITDKIESLQAELIALKGFVMAQIYLNSEYNDE
jgi:CHASE3 domain sensor protein